MTKKSSSLTFFLRLGSRHLEVVGYFEKFQMKHEYTMPLIAFYTMLLDILLARELNGGRFDERLPWGIC